MTYFNEKYINKSYVLDFRINGVTQDLVVFSVPPQTESFKFPQRIYETKTFGGIVYDDYGNDSVKISLAGTTINNELRLIYKKNTTSASAVSGDEEIQYIKDLIRSYGKKNKLKNKTVYLYINGDDTAQTFWQVLIEDFDIKRSKDKPLSYDYQLEMIGVSDEVSMLGNIVPGLNNITSAIDNVVETIDNATGAVDNLAATLDNIDKSLDNKTAKIIKSVEKIKKQTETVSKVLRWDERIINGCQKVQATIKKIENDCVEVFDIMNREVRNLVDRPINVVKEIINTGEAIVDGVFRVPFVVLDKVINDTSELIKDVCDIVVWGRDLITNPDTILQIAMSYIDEVVQDAEDLTDYLTGILGGMEDTNNELNAILKEEEEEEVIIPGDKNSDDRLLKVYGYKEYDVQDGDTWDSIAYKFYGIADYAIVLASYNSDINELKVGIRIYIPVFVKQESAVNDDVYNSEGEKDNFGKDISLGQKGEIKIVDGDFLLISGQDNLDQAIENRLSSEVENSIRKVAYGIKSSVGSSYIPSGYILASVKQTLMMDKRIKSVDSISYKGIKDKLLIKIVYTTINDYQKTYEGVM